MSKIKQTARLEHWQTLPTMDNKLIMRGIVFGHPKLRDGDVIFTTQVVSVDTLNGVAETLNTRYTLGKPAEREPNYN